MPLYGSRNKRNVLRKDVLPYNGQELPYESVSPFPFKEISFVNAEPNSEDNFFIKNAISYNLDNPIEINRIPSLGIERTIPTPIFLGGETKPNKQFLYTNPDYPANGNLFYNELLDECETYFLFANIQSKKSTIPFGFRKRNLDSELGEEEILPTNTGDYEVVFVEQSEDRSKIQISSIDLILRNIGDGFKVVVDETYDYDNWYSGNFNDYVVSENVSIGYTNDTIVKRNLGERYNWSHGTIYFIKTIGPEIPITPPQPPQPPQPPRPEFCIRCEDNTLCLPECPIINCDDICLDEPEYNFCQPSRIPCPSVFLGNECEFTIPPPEKNHDSMCLVDDSFSYLTESEDISFDNYKEYYSGTDLFEYYNLKRLCIYELDFSHEVNEDGILKLSSLDEDDKKLVDCFNEENTALNVDNLIVKNGKIYDNYNSLNTNQILGREVFYFGDTNFDLQQTSTRNLIIDDIDDFNLDRTGLDLCDVQKSLIEILDVTVPIDYICNVYSVKRKEFLELNDNLDECMIKVISPETTGTGTTGTTGTSAYKKTCLELLEYKLVLTRKDETNVERIYHIFDMRMGINRDIFKWIDTYGSRFKIYAVFKQDGLFNINVGDVLRHNTSEITTFSNKNEIRLLSFDHVFVDITNRIIKIKEIECLQLSCYDEEIKPKFYINCVGSSCNNIGTVGGEITRLQNDCLSENVNSIDNENEWLELYNTLIEDSVFNDNKINTESLINYKPKNVFIDETNQAFRNGIPIEISYDDIIILPEEPDFILNSILNIQGLDYSYITSWNLYEITNQKNERDLLKTNLIENWSGNNFDYEFSGEENKNYELVVCYKIEVDGCDYSECKIILIKYQPQINIDCEPPTIECNFKKMPIEGEEDDVNYEEYRRRYEQTSQYDILSNRVTEETHENTDYSTCGAGPILIISEIKDITLFNNNNFKYLVYSDIQGLLGEMTPTILTDNNDENPKPVLLLESTLIDGDHKITKICLEREDGDNIDNGGDSANDGSNWRIIGRHTIDIKHFHMDPSCEEVWNINGNRIVPSFPESFEEFSEVTYDFLPNEIRLSALPNAPKTPQNHWCFRENIERWEEINEINIENINREVRTHNVEGRVGNIFVNSSIESGRCITFTVGEDCSIKIHVDFLKDPNDPCCTCAPGKNEEPDCDPECPPEGWEETGREEEECDPGTEWINPEHQNIFQPTRKGEMVQQVDPADNDAFGDCGIDVDGNENDNEEEIIDEEENVDDNFEQPPIPDDLENYDGDLPDIDQPLPPEPETQNPDNEEAFPPVPDAPEIDVPDNLFDLNLNLDDV